VRLIRWLLAWPILLVVSACQSGPAANADLAQATVVSEPDGRAALPPAAVVVEPAEQPSFDPPDALEAAAQTAEPDTAAAESNDENVTASPTASDGSALPEETATPMPTFTPPGSPESSPWEHYWLHRPVPEGSAVWTDKAYPYGSTRDGTLRPHHGVEFNVPAGTAVLAATDGTVVMAGSDASVQLGAIPDFYGNAIVIEHGFLVGGERVFTLYGHLSEVLVTEGQQVRANDLIGLSGASGVADGAHLHFEVRAGDNSYESTLNPLLWLNPFPDRAVVAGRVVGSDGTPASAVPITLRRIDAPAPYSATVTYSSGSVNGDRNWQENFALDDVAAGYYELTIGSGSNKVKRTLWVYPNQTNFVEVNWPG
jgi:murein DD-endopeptidase MepM/ murein hydrolase activator NlpD